MILKLNFVASMTILLAARVSPGPTPEEIAERSRSYENLQHRERYYEMNRETLDPKERASRNVVKDAWRESSVEELASATGSNDRGSYLDGKRVGEGRRDDRRSSGNDWRDAVSGVPRMDYPDHTRIPATSFTCLDKDPGGYYADTETGCQVFHVCNTGGVKSSFLCPAGSIFDQRYFVCDWWYRFKCDGALSSNRKKSSPDPNNSSAKSRAEELDGKKMAGKVARKLVKETRPAEEHWGVASYENPHNDLSLANKIEQRSENPRKSLGTNDRKPKNKFGTDARVHPKDYGNAWKDHENRTNIDNEPRGFSRDRDDESLRKKNVVGRSHDLTNDLASYVNYAYFDAQSNDSDLSDNNNDDEKDRDQKE